MNTGSLTREHKLFIAAGGSVLFVISMFIDWFGAGGFGINGLDLLPSGWIFLIFGILAALLFAAEALNIELPPAINPLTFGVYFISVCTVITVAVFLEGGALGADAGRQFGLFLALIGSIVAVAAGAIAARDKV